MPTYLFRFLILVGLMVCAGLGYGQDSVTVRNEHYKIQEPLMLIKPNIIASGGLYPVIIPKDILNIEIHKNNNIPLALRGLTLGGVISIDYKKRIPSQSFAQVARRQGVRQPFRVVLNGRPLSADQVKALRIAPGAIGKVCVTPATFDASEAVLAIQLAEAKSVKHPPGSIFIR